MGQTSTADGRNHHNSCTQNEWWQSTRRSQRTADNQHHLTKKARRDRAQGKSRNHARFEQRQERARLQVGGVERVRVRLCKRTNKQRKRSSSTISLVNKSDSWTNCTEAREKPNRIMGRCYVSQNINRRNTYKTMTTQVYATREAPFRTIRNTSQPGQPTRAAPWER